MLICDKPNKLNNINEELILLLLLYCNLQLAILWAHIPWFVLISVPLHRNPWWKSIALQPRCGNSAPAICLNWPEIVCWWVAFSDSVCILVIMADFSKAWITLATEAETAHPSFFCLRFCHYWFTLRSVRNSSTEAEEATEEKGTIRSFHFRFRRASACISVSVFRVHTGTKGFFYLPIRLRFCFRRWCEPSFRKHLVF